MGYEPKLTAKYERMIGVEADVRLPCEAKSHVAAMLKIDPTTTIAEADAFYRLLCFEPAFRAKMARGLREAGMPE